MSVEGAIKHATFRKLGLRSELVNVLDRQGITTPFPIQAAAIPDALAGFDILGKGQTGSGKTLAFGLALLNNLADQKAKPHRPLALVLAPTRELAQQINDVLTPLAKAICHSTVVVSGGMPFNKQIMALRKSTSIVVATPGRLLDLVKKNELQLDQLEIVVLDEADQMADMGFLPDVKRILDLVKPGGQRFLFSATLDRGVDGLVAAYLNNPRTHTVEQISGTKEKSDHFVFLLNHNHKAEITSQIAAREGKSIFFVRTKRGADRLASNLATAGVQVGTLHGGKSQAIRTRTLAQFKKQNSGVLVATDVAARGIHVDDIDLVVHFDAPADHKDYLHRSGRTARAGRAGRVVTLATHKDQKSISGITSRAGVEPKLMQVTPMAEGLVKVTGAKLPSGIPIVTVELESKPQPKSRNGQRSRRKPEHRKQQSGSFKGKRKPKPKRARAKSNNF